MASSNNNETISKASPHTQKKFELISSYIESWAQILLNVDACHGLVFIDCMSNSGVYHDSEGNEIEGTPLRVAKILRNAAGQYPWKQVYVYFNDLDVDKTELLKTRLPKETRNFHVEVKNFDANELLKSIGNRLDEPNMHYFLLYDPYDAHIDWEALLPFFRYWGEVMINHMVSDPVRAISQVKNQAAKEKYEGTYLMDFEKLLPFGSDKQAYENRIHEIINSFTSDRRYYVASYPFFNTQNSKVYDLIHCTSNLVGHNLYKKVAWKTFGGQSSAKKSAISGGQVMLNFDDPSELSLATDESCFTARDIAKYIQENFAGQQGVTLNRVWELLEQHPIFPSDGYRRPIRDELEQSFGAVITKALNPVNGKKVDIISFSKGTGIK